MKAKAKFSAVDNAHHHNFFSRDWKAPIHCFHLRYIANSGGGPWFEAFALKPNLSSQG